GLTWTFNLRRGVKFHHGREVTADDVVFSLSRIPDPRARSGAADLFMNIEGAREFREGRAKTVMGLVAIDPHTVQITLQGAQGPFVAVLAVGHARIVPRDMVERLGDAFGDQPVGTGPFRLERWERVKEIVLAANQEYFAGPPRLAKLVYRIFPGEQFDAMYGEFFKGNLEDTPTIPGEPASCSPRPDTPTGAASRRSRSGRASDTKDWSASTSKSSNTWRRWAFRARFTISATGRRTRRRWMKGSYLCSCMGGTPMFRTPTTSCSSCSSPRARGIFSATQI